MNTRRKPKPKTVDSYRQFEALNLQGMSLDDATEYATSLPRDEEGYSQRRRALLKWRSEQTHTAEQVKRGLRIVYDYIGDVYVVVDERGGGLREFVARSRSDADEFARQLRPRRVGF